MANKINEKQQQQYIFNLNNINNNNHIYINNNNINSINNLIKILKSKKKVNLNLFPTFLLNKNIYFSLFINLKIKIISLFFIIRS